MHVNIAEKKKIKSSLLGIMCVCVCVHACKRVQLLRGKISLCWGQVPCLCCDYSMLKGKNKKVIETGNVPFL